MTASLSYDMFARAPQLGQGDEISIRPDDVDRVVDPHTRSWKDEPRPPAPAKVPARDMESILKNAHQISGDSSKNRRGAKLTESSSAVEVNHSELEVP